MARSTPVKRELKRLQAHTRRIAARAEPTAARIEEYCDAAQQYARLAETHTDRGNREAAWTAKRILKMYRKLAQIALEGMEYIVRETLAATDAVFECSSLWPGLEGSAVRDGLLDFRKTFTDVATR